MILLVCFIAEQSPGQAFDPPMGGWTYIFEGDNAAPGTGGAGAIDALDGTWCHDNGSDAWDGTAIGTGIPGGVNALTEGTITYVRLQDTGDPRDYGAASGATGGDDPSNRKVYLGHDIAAEGASATILNDGVTISFRARVPTTQPPFNEQHPDGGGGIGSWLTSGDGYVIHDGGKGNFGIHQADGGVISFSLAGNPDVSLYGLSAAGLVMNDLNGTASTSNVDQQDSDGGQLNLLPIDVTQWHEFWIVIQGGGTGTHQVSVWTDGNAAGSYFDVTAGSGEDFDTSYLALGVGATPQLGALDVDFFAYRAGKFIPGLIPGDVNDDGEVDLLDLTIIRTHYFEKVTSLSDGDANQDGIVDFLDYRIWKENSSIGAVPLFVPEPASLGLVFLGALVILGFRRHYK